MADQLPQIPDDHVPVTLTWSAPNKASIWHDFPESVLDSLKEKFALAVFYRQDRSPVVLAHIPQIHFDEAAKYAKQSYGEKLELALA